MQVTLRPQRSSFSVKNRRVSGRKACQKTTTACAGTGRCSPPEVLFHAAAAVHVLSFVVATSTESAVASAGGSQHLATVLVSYKCLHVYAPFQPMILPSTTSVKTSVSAACTIHAIAKCHAVLDDVWGSSGLWGFGRVMCP